MNDTELSPEHAISILKEIARLDSQLFDLAVANVNNTGLNDMVNSQQEVVKTLQAELAELKGTEGASSSEDADTKIEDTEEANG